jgi:hypothetical protein
MDCPELISRAVVWIYMTRTAAESFDPQFLRTLRAAPWRTIEKRFLIILVGSIGLHVAFATWIATQPLPVTQAQRDELQDRVPARVTLPPLLPIPKLPPVVAAPARVPTAAPPTTGVPGKPVDRGQIAKAAVIKMLGSGGPNGAFSNLLAGPIDEIASALDGAKSVRVGSLEPIAPKGPATGEAATIDRLGTDGARHVAIGTRTDRLPFSAVPGAITVDDPEEVDPRVLQKFITARRAAVQHCYEREIHHNPAMKGGKVVLRMSIGTGGRVSSLSVEEDTLGAPGVTACMSTLMKRWIFPVAPKDEIPLSVPFVFARAN